MSKLMILGGSNCQKNALLAARRLGHQTVLVDYYENPPAAALADVHVRASTFDIPACTAAARLHGVNGVLTLGTDQPVYTAAEVARRLGLPSCIDVPTALAVTNKRVMKERLTHHGIPTVRYRFLGRGEHAEAALAGLRAPFVLKPLDSQGQRGIFKLATAGGVGEHLAQTLSFSRCEEALVEEFYPSDEITVSGWVSGGRLDILAVTDRQTYSDPKHIGVCVGHRFPTVHMALYPEIERISREITAAFGIHSGPLYIQMLVGDEGCLVNELACRIGGAFEDVFLPYLSGFPILDAVLGAALGKAPDVSMLAGFSPPRCQKQAAVQLMFCRPGKISAITSLEEIRALPFVADAGYNFAAGETIPEMENATARLGHCVMLGEDGDMEEKVKEFYRVFRVLDENGNNMVIPRTWTL